MTALTVLASDIDQLRLEIGDGVILGVKAIVAIFLFAIALDTEIADFKRIARRPWVILAGLTAQFVLMPALTVLLTLALDVRGSVAIGMILVVCCPAGNLSNLLTHRCRGDVALSVSMTTVSTLAALVVTPVALAFWSGLNPAADALLRDIEIDPWELVGEAVLLIGLPFLLGLLAAWRWPAASTRARRIVEPGVLVLLALLIVSAAARQLDTLVEYVGAVAIPIVLQNALSLAVGYGTGRAIRLPEPGVRAMTLELGLRNTGLGLVLALGFFPDLGGVALVCALWGLWDVVTGLVLSTWWRRRLPATAADQPAGAAPSG